MSLGLTGEGLRCKTLSHKNPPNPPFVRGEANSASPPYEGGVGGGSWDTRKVVPLEKAAR